MLLHPPLLRYLSWIHKAQYHTYPFMIYRASFFLFIPLSRFWTQALHSMINDTMSNFKWKCYCVLGIKPEWNHHAQYIFVSLFLTCNYSTIFLLGYRCSHASIDHLMNLHHTVLLNEPSVTMLTQYTAIYLNVTTVETTQRSWSCSFNCR